MAAATELWGGGEGWHRRKGRAAGRGGAAAAAAAAGGGGGTGRGRGVAGRDGTTERE